MYDSVLIDNISYECYNQIKKGEIFMKSNKVLITLIICISVVLLTVIVGGAIIIFEKNRTPNYSLVTQSNNKPLIENGVIITLQPDTSNATKEQFDTVETIFQTRLTNAGYIDAHISTDLGKKTITVAIPFESDSDKAVKLLSDTAKLTFTDADGNVVLDGATDIKDAKYEYSKINETGGNVHHVTVTFDSAARQKFADATKKAAALSASGKNYISIKLDENIISSPRVSEQINSESCVISGDFTAETAKDLANKIKSGQLPFNLIVVSVDVKK